MKKLILLLAFLLMCSLSFAATQSTNNGAYASCFMVWNGQAYPLQDCNKYTVASAAGVTAALATGNLGIGTATPAAALVVNGGFLVLNSGNVGINSSMPGAQLDVQGSTRTTYFAMTSSSPSNGKILQATDSSGDAIWATPSTSPWTTVNTNDVTLPNLGNVGIGTSVTNQGAALSVMNGNVGIGTLTPGSLLALQSSSNILLNLQPTTSSLSAKILLNGRAYWQYNASTANIEFSDNASGKAFIWIQSNATHMTLTAAGNLGVGTVTPGQALDVFGTARATFFATNVGIGTSGSGVTSCICKQYSGGLCLNATCT